MTPTTGAKRAATKIHDRMRTRCGMVSGELETFTAWIDEETAAPELLEVLERVLGWIDCGVQQALASKMGEMSYHAMLCRTSKQALAKARGES